MMISICYQEVLWKWQKYIMAHCRNSIQICTKNNTSPLTFHHRTWWFLYATRKFYGSDRSILWHTAEIAYRFESPQRYKKYADAIQTHEESCQFHLTSAAEVGGRKPRVLSTDRSLLGDISRGGVRFLEWPKVLFTCQIIEPFEEIPPLKASLDGITGLEVLHLQNGFVWSSISLHSLLVSWYDVMLKHSLPC